MSQEMEKAVAKIGGAFNELKSDVLERVERLEALGDRPKGATNIPSHQWKAVGDFMRTGRGLEVAEGKSMAIGTAADGGAMVPELIADEIVNRALARGGLASIVRRTRSPTSDYVRLLNMRGQAGAWIDEAGTRTATANLKLREVRPPHGELYSAVVVSNWLLNDAKFNVDAMVVDNFVEQLARSLESAVYNGAGSGKPKGVVTSTVTTTDNASPERAADAIQFVASTGDLGNALIGAFFTLKPEYRRNATWVMSSASLSQVRQLRDSNGSGYLWQANLGQGVDSSDGTLLGKPVVTCEDLPTIGGSPQVKGVLVGDFVQAYELVEIGPMSIIRDPYSTRGFTTLYLAARFGGRLVDNDAVKALAA